MLKVNMGNQKHTSPLKHREEDGSLSWDWKMPMVTQVPIKNRIVRMELHTTSSSTKPGKLVATALIPLFQLMGFSQGAHMPWLLWQSLHATQLVNAYWRMYNVKHLQSILLCYVCNNM